MKKLIVLAIVLTSISAAAFMPMLSSTESVYTQLQGFESQDFTTGFGWDTTVVRYCILATFQADFTDTVDAVSVYLIKNGSPTQEVTVSVCDSSGGATPTPSNCIDSTTTIDMSTYSDGWSATLDLTTGFTMTSANEYIVIVEADAIDASNYPKWSLDAETEYHRTNPTVSCGGTWADKGDDATGTFRLYKKL